MTRIRQQFNPSTLKAAYNPITGKAMVVDLDITSECAHCTDVQPAWVDVTLSEWADCECCHWDGEGVYGISSNDELNDTYRVPHSAGCVYTKKFSGSPGDYGYYKTFTGAVDCSGEPADEVQWAKLEITVTAADGKATVFLKRYTADEGDWLWCFGDEVDGIKDITYTGDDACLDTDNYAEHTPGSSCCTNGGFYSNGPSGKAHLAVP